MTVGGILAALTNWQGHSLQSNTKTISASALRKMDKEVFWSSLEQQGTKKLVITRDYCEDLIYENGILKRLLQIKPDLYDLTKEYLLEFSGYVQIYETKARLLLCGGAFDFLFNKKNPDYGMNSVSLPLLSPEDLQMVLHAIETESDDLSVCLNNFEAAMGKMFLTVPEGVHGRKNWSERGIEVGYVPPMPEELLASLDAPCPISNNGSKKIDTHVILWMPSRMNADPVDLTSLERYAFCYEFGENKVKYVQLLNSIRLDAEINRPFDNGYWLALYKTPVAGGIEDKRTYVADHCPGYQYPTVREVVACSFMQFGCSGNRRERILDWDQDVHFTFCEEQINGRHFVVGAMNQLGLHVDIFHYKNPKDSPATGVCPVQRYFSKSLC